MGQGRVTLPQRTVWALRKDGTMPTRPAAKKRKGDVKEDIANNQFGEDFAMENVTALMNAEVQAILAMSVDTQQVDEQSEMMQVWVGITCVYCMLLCVACLETQPDVSACMLARLSGVGRVG